MATSSVLWARLPDALLLIDAESIVDANPAATDVFGCERSWLLGRSPAELLPAERLRPAEHLSPIFTAQRRDGEAFLATASLVTPAPSADMQLVLVRDMSTLSTWLDAKQHAVEMARETLTQHLFGIGIALRVCIESDETDLGHDRLERTIDVLDAVRRDLDRME